MRRLHLVIHGRVQGVGFRGYVQHRARELDVNGRVRNLPDGSVEMDAEGSEAVLRELVTQVRRGPRTATVGEVEETWSEGPERWDTFEIAWA